jgi:hypothetical protein
VPHHQNASADAAGGDIGNGLDDARLCFGHRFEALGDIDTALNPTVQISRAFAVSCQIERGEFACHFRRRLKFPGPDRCRPLCHS